MTENTAQTREEELEAEIAELRAQNVPTFADALSTRGRSPIKPTDHKPADSTKATVVFLEESYTFDVRAFKDPRTLFAFNREDLESALLRIIGAEDLNRAIVSTEDSDGYADIERLGPLVELISEAAGAKN